MSYKDDIRRIARENLPKTGLSVLEERPSIVGVVTPPKKQENSDIKPPLTMTVTLETQVQMEERENEGKIYQGGDTSSENWVQVKIAKTALIVDANGKQFAIETITFIEP